ncbi:ATP-binding cassette domain-containing protein, partial [Brucella sp. NBRC 12950]|uniref:ATP-binding cassette domain-containing protein n=1 Tax=Brucella sp. NBRC 12950 TaxID=2994518 RepID=UPI0025559637
PAMIAVDNVSLELSRGQNLGIIGESGCGKSTLARVIAGILPAVRGKIRFDGEDMPSDLRYRSREQLRQLQIVFQFADTALNPAKSIGDILSRPLSFYHGMD